MNVVERRTEHTGDVIGLDPVEVNKPPLSLINRQAIKDVFFFPTGRKSHQCGVIGDTLIAALGPARDLRATFPNATIHVASPFSSFFKQDRMRTYDKDIEETLRKEGDGSIVLMQAVRPDLAEERRHPCRDEINGYLERGGNALIMSSGHSILFRPGDRQVGRCTNCITNAQLEYGWEPYHRSLMKGVGCENSGPARIELDGYKETMMEDRLRGLGLRPKGEAIRVALTLDAYTDREAILEVDKAGNLVYELLAKDFDVFIDPGKDGVTYDRMKHTLGERDHLAMPDRMGVSDLTYALGASDMVLCPNTGIMWIADALDKHTLTYTENPITSASYLPYGTKTYQFPNSKGAQMQGVGAVSLMLSGKGFNVFSDPIKARREAVPYVRDIISFDPLKYTDDGTRLLASDARLKRIEPLIKDEYRAFFTRVDPWRGDIIRSHQQHPLYRFLNNALDRESQERNGI